MSSSSSVYPSPINAFKQSKRSVLSVIVDNEPEILARIVGLFSGRGYNIEALSIKFPTVGVAAKPDVVSDSPHFTEIHRSHNGHSSLCYSDSHITNSCAFVEAFIVVPMSPVLSM